MKSHDNYKAICDHEISDKSKKLHCKKQWSFNNLNREREVCYKSSEDKGIG